MSTDGGHPHAHPGSRPAESTAAPPAAASRAYLRGGLPAVFLDGDFTMRFVGSLEEQLDPIVATLDSLAGLLSPETAPLHLLRLEASWLGLHLDEDLPVGVCRDLVRHASELNRQRGTAAGLQLLLSLTFPDVPLQVEDRGRVTFGDGAAPSPPARHEFLVRSPRGLHPDRRAAIAHVIDRERPAHVAYQLIDSPTWPVTR